MGCQGAGTGRVVELDHFNARNGIGTIVKDYSRVIKDDVSNRFPPAACTSA